MLQGREMVELRIHHFFDIIRDYGIGKDLVEHPYGHSYHNVGNLIYENRVSKIRLVVKSDDICRNCKMLKFGKCVDTIQHRVDFNGKEEFNNHIDTRIMRCMGFKVGQIISIDEILIQSTKYLDSISDIYSGNDESNTMQRKNNVLGGIHKKMLELGIP